MKTITLMLKLTYPDDRRGEANIKVGIKDYEQLEPLEKSLCELLGHGIYTVTADLLKALDVWKEAKK